jgi:hypothetical protein
MVPSDFFNTTGQEFSAAVLLISLSLIFRVDVTVETGA